MSVLAAVGGATSTSWACGCANRRHGHRARLSRLHVQEADRAGDRAIHNERPPHLHQARARRGRCARLACGSISHMTELTDVSGAFGYGDSILAGERVRLRGVRDDDLPALAKWEMDPGRMVTLSSWVAPPSEAAAKERIAKWSANGKDDLGFAIETLEDPPVLIGNIGLWGTRPKDRCATLGIALGREYVGRGYGTAAMRVIVD